MWAELHLVAGVLTEREPRVLRCKARARAAGSARLWASTLARCPTAELSQNIGAMGSCPSICAPTGGACCRQTKTITSDKLTPWDEDLIMTLRGPLDIRQFATYQPTVEGQASPWQLVSSFDARTPATSKGIAFSGDAAKGGKTFAGTVASTCLVNASTDKDFGCGPASSPYCSATSSNKKAGWAGSKMFVFLASMPHVGSGGITTDQNCQPTTNGWNDALWIGLSVGELIRAGAFSTCQCYETTPYHGDGCGQINALEVINDNDTSGNYKNLEIFSSNFLATAETSADRAARTIATRPASQGRSIWSPARWRRPPVSPARKRQG